MIREVFVIRPRCGVPPMTREICEDCGAPYMSSFASSARVCCGCALGYPPGKPPTWQSLGGLPETDNRRAGSPGYTRKGMVERTCTDCGDTFFGAKDRCRVCREKERHKRRWREHKKMA